MKLAFTNVHFRDSSACITQKWFRFKRVITVGLEYISKIFPNGSKIIKLLFSTSYLRFASNRGLKRFCIF